MLHNSLNIPHYAVVDISYFAVGVAG
jgi:hypothetical protein